MQAGKVTVALLKPFVFTEPSVGGERLPTEHRFVPNKDGRGRYVLTEVEIDEVIAAHPFISRYFADGAIESPAQRAVRMAAAEKREKEDKELNDRVNADAEAALARAQGNSHRQMQLDERERDNLNTPVSELNGKHNAGLTTQAGHKVDLSDPKVQEELNTPINVLRARQAAKTAGAKPAAKKKV